MKNKYTCILTRTLVSSMLASTIFLTACSPLLSAARNNNIAEVRQLLDSGADVNENFRGETALVYASVQGNTAIAKLLLDRGASIDASMGYGLTPLVYAVDHGHTDLAQLLIERGANVDGAVVKLQSLGDGGRAGLALLQRLTKNKQTINNVDTTHAVSNIQVNQTASNTTELKAPPPVPALAPPDSNAVAIIIGIEKYQSLPPAGFVRSDANLIRTYLKAMGYQDRNIEFLTDERATFSSIRKAVETWLPNRINSKSRVTVYYAGHGAPDPQNGDAYIVPYDGDPSYLPDTGYPLKRLYAKLEELPAQQVVVLIDACFSGAGGRGVLAPGARSLVRVEKTIPKGNRIAVLTSTEGTQISTSSPEKKQGLFTYYLIQAFQEGNRDLASVYDYLRPKVEDEAKRINVDQTPSISPHESVIKGKFRLW